MRGGRRGIRTPGSLHFNGFQDRRIRPLCHPSIFSCSTLFLSLSRGYRSKAQRFDEIAPAANDFYSVTSFLPRHAAFDRFSILPYSVVLLYFCRFGAGTASKRNGLTKSRLRRTISIPSLRSLQDTPHSTASQSFHIQLFHLISIALAREPLQSATV